MPAAASSAGLRVAVVERDTVGGTCLNRGCIPAKAYLEPAAVQALVERCGTDIVRLRAGLERVGLYGLGQRTLTASDVRDSVPAGPEAHQDFGVANAIKDGDAARALREVPEVNCHASSV